MKRIFAILAVGTLVGGAGLLGGCRRDPVTSALKAMEAGNTQKAEQLLSEAVKQDPTDASALANLALLQYRSRQYDPALIGFAKAADLVPDDPRPIEYIAAILIENNDLDSAGKMLADAARRDPRSASIQTAQAVVELYTVGAPAARTHLLQILNMDPTYAPALFNLAVIDRDWLKDQAEARRYFQRFLAVAKNDVHAPIAKAALAERVAPAPVRTVAPAASPVTPRPASTPSRRRSR